MKKWLFLIWIMKTFVTLDSVTTFLNSLPVQQSLHAKIVVVDSQWTIFGPLTESYNIFYPSDLL